jgi:hypothetical protein
VNSDRAESIAVWVSITVRAEFVKAQLIWICASTADVANSKPSSNRGGRNMVREGFLRTTGGLQKRHAQLTIIGDMKGRWMLDRREGGSARRIDSMV